MDRLSIAMVAPLAAFTFSSHPAAAQPLIDPAFSSSGSSAQSGGFPDWGGVKDRRHRRSNGVVIWGGTWAGDGWAEYNNRGWQPDSFNDWWHDRPERAYPRWVQEQKGTMCAPERVWWSGAGWRC